MSFLRVLQIYFILCIIITAGVLVRVFFFFFFFLHFLNSIHFILNILCI